jgi:hypothetical protein
MQPKSLTLAAVLAATTALPCAAQTHPQPSPQQPVQTVLVTPHDRVIVWGPTPVGSSLAWMGRAMQGLGTRHVWTIHHDRYRPLKRQPAGYYLIHPAAVASPQTASP